MVAAEQNVVRERNMRLGLACASAIVLSLAAGTAQAHHSFAMFDSKKKVTLSGTVREFQWTNPHCYIQLSVPDGKGGAQEWSLEMGAPMYLYANGWRPRSLKSGDKISVSINPLRNGKPGGVVIGATKADGQQIGKGPLVPGN
jgi:hypothetical protein